MLGFGVLELQGISLPVEYNVELRTVWFLCILPGLLLIIMVVSMTFEASMRRALEDVEAQKATIEKQSKELEKLIEDKDSIIGILGHDLEDPLANIDALAKLLPEEKDESSRQNILRMIGKASGSAFHLVTDVLQMATLEQAGSSITLQPVKVQAVIQDVVQSLNTAVESKGMQINVDNQHAEPSVLADATYFRQVIENLISNALKFSASGNTVDVVVAKNEGAIRIRVRDYGPGVPVVEEDRLFKRFSRLSTQPTAGENFQWTGAFACKTLHGIDERERLA